jgi:hypothetical protein
LAESGKGARFFDEESPRTPLKSVSLVQGFQGQSPLIDGFDGFDRQREQVVERAGAVRRGSQLARSAYVVVQMIGVGVDAVTRRRMRHGDKSFQVQFDTASLSARRAGRAARRPFNAVAAQPVANLRPVLFQQIHGNHDTALRISNGPNQYRRMRQSADRRRLAVRKHRALRFGPREERGCVILARPARSNLRQIRALVSQHQIIYIFAMLFIDIARQTW